MTFGPARRREGQTDEMMTERKALRHATSIRWRPISETCRSRNGPFGQTATRRSNRAAFRHSTRHR